MKTPCLSLAVSSVVTFLAVTALHAQSNYATPYAFTTLAGSAGVSGSADGTGSAARFATPEGLAVDSAGNVYVADTNNHTIRKITGAGVVTTLAGTSGNWGSADGTGNSARFDSPFGVAVDAGGNVYVADLGNSTIRKITSSGVVTTLAGSPGAAGSADGTGSAARFSFPTGLAADSAGNIYVADQNNNTIRMITSAGDVSTLAGTPGSWGSADGTGSAARFNGPVGVAADTLGNVYVSEGNNFTIRKITSSGVVTTLAGRAGSLGSVDGTGSAARFNFPASVAVDGAGNIYVADQGLRTIRKITSGGEVTTLAGMYGGGLSSVDGTGSAARFNAPHGVAVDTVGNVYVADTFSHTIRKGALAQTTGARVVNLSVRSTAGSGSQTLIVGFVITGTGSKQMLLRGVGPTLASYGVVNAIADPGLRLFNGGTEVAANEDWGGSAGMAASFSAVGAVALPGNSKDAAIYNTIASGAYTFYVTASAGPTGVALAELYDADAMEGPAKVVNISARTQVGTGENILIAGFVITGNTPKTMLIRGVGPTLASYGVTGALADPQLNLFNGSTLITSNDNWGGTTALKDAFSQVGAVALASDTSKDAALLVTLQPGVYTAQVSGAGNTTGVGLVEIYLMP